MTRQWWLALAIGVAGGAFAACGGTSDGMGSVTSAAKPGETLDVTGGGELSCSDRTTCFDVDSSFHNITHLFFDWDTECVDLDDVRIEVTDLDSGDTDEFDGDDLHTRGGPCHDIERVAWLPLGGRQEHVEVCVTFEGDGDIPGGISVGAKAANLCEEAGDTEECLDCQNNNGGNGGNNNGGEGGNNNGGAGGECPPLG